MKSLKIKSYLIGFIVVMISLFSFNDKASALEFDFNGIYFDSDEILDRMKDKYSNADFENTYRYHIAFLRDNSLYFIFTDRIYAYDIENKSFLLYEEDFNSYSDKYSSYLAYGSAGWGFWTRRLFYYYRYDFNNNTEEINTTNNAYNELLFASKSEKLDNETWEQFLNRKVLYSNINFSLQEAISNENYYRPYDINLSKIKLTKTYANDLDGTDFYNIRADFEDIYDESYTYQFKTDNFNDWVDITGNIKTAAQEGYYIYDYSCYYNTNIHFRVLDSSGEVIDENSISVSELNNFEMEISHNPANDLQGRYVNAVTVNLHNCWNDNYTYQYSFDNETFYNMEINNKQFVLNHGIQTFLYFRILDENNNIIYTRDYEVIFNGLLKSVNIDEDVRTDENNEKYIRAIITFTEFSEFSDTYNLKYYLNDIELEETDDLYVYEWNKEQYYSFKGVEIVVKIDNFVVYSAFYLPSMGDKTFEDKYDDVVEDNLEEELGDNDYSDVNGMLEAVKSFINAIKNFINAFFSLILVFFNRLNVWLKSMIIGLFIVMVICRIIKAVRK